MLPWPLGKVIPLPSEETPSNQVAALKLLQEGATPEQLSTHRGAQVVKDLATDIDTAKDAYTRNSLVMGGVKRYANSAKGR